MSRVRAVIGLAIVAGCLLFSYWALYDLVQFGSCASGGPYVSARECAPGTGWKIGGLTFSIFGVLIGVAITGSSRAGLATWGLGFCGLAATFLVATFGPSHSDQSSAAFGIGMGALFGVMGLPVLIASMAPDRSAKQRGIKLEGPYGTGVTVRTPQDGGPAPIVQAAMPPASPFGGSTGNDDA